MSILNIFDYTCTIKRNVWVYSQTSRVAVWQICILSDLDYIFSFSARLLSSQLSQLSNADVFMFDWFSCTDSRKPNVALKTDFFPAWQVNLKYGVRGPETRTGTETDTCTACAGTIILEFAALSRFTGDPVFEVSNVHQKIRKTKQYIYI